MLMATSSDSHLTCAAADPLVAIPRRRKSPGWQQLHHLAGGVIPGFVEIAAPVSRMIEPESQNVGNFLGVVGLPYGS